MHVNWLRALGTQEARLHLVMEEMIPAPHVLHGTHCESTGENRRNHCLDSDIYINDHMMITMSRCKLKMLHGVSCLSYVAVSMLLFLSSLLKSLVVFTVCVLSVENEYPNFEPTNYRWLLMSFRWNTDTKYDEWHCELMHYNTIKQVV